MIDLKKTVPSLNTQEKNFWKNWKPTAQTCLCFVLRGEEVLLMRKKRGSGAGKINAPGGYIESGESAHDAAVREVQEELKVTPLNLQKVGELSFQFIDRVTGLPQTIKDDPSGALHCVVFVATGCLGDPQETEEAVPFWYHQQKIPYDAMWDDDREWIPGMLEGRCFSGYYFFDQEEMLSGRLEWYDHS